MIRSPGSVRRLAEPVPEDVLLRLDLLGFKITWDSRAHGWTISYRGGVDNFTFWPFEGIQIAGWDDYLGRLADRTVPPDKHASMINEEAFKHV